MTTASSSQCLTSRTCSTNPCLPLTSRTGGSRSSTWNKDSSWTMTWKQMTRRATTQNLSAATWLKWARGSNTFSTLEKRSVSSAKRQHSSMRQSKQTRSSSPWSQRLEVLLIKGLVWIRTSNWKIKIGWKGIFWARFQWTTCKRRPAKTAISIWNPRVRRDTMLTNSGATTCLKSTPCGFMTRIPFAHRRPFSKMRTSKSQQNRR